MPTNLPEGFDNLETRAFQMWNSDIKRYVADNALDLSAQIVSPNFSNGRPGVPSTGVKMYQLIDGHWHMHGLIEFIGTTAILTNEPMIDFTQTPFPIANFPSVFREKFGNLVESAAMTPISQPGFTVVITGIMRNAFQTSYHLYTNGLTITTNDIISVDVFFSPV